MGIMYIFFVVLLVPIRLLASYDSRYQSGKFLYIKNNVLSKILLDSTSMYSRVKRLEEDKNKMSILGFVLYVAAAIVLLINLIFLIVADIPIEPWSMEISDFVIQVITLNDKISVSSILLLSAIVVNCIAFTMIRITKQTSSKCAKVVIWIISVILILMTVFLAVYFLTELVESCS